jgi:methyl-accepting chemotaxis protein
MAAYELLDFAPRNYKRPQTEGSITKLTSLAENDGHEMTARNLDDLVDKIFENSMVEIESLIDEFERLRTKLRTSRESIKRDIEEHRVLSQQAMELTETLSGSVEEFRASVDRHRDEPPLRPVRGPNRASVSRAVFDR